MPLDELANLSNSSQQKRDAALLRATTELFLHETGHDRDEIRRYEELATHFLPRVSLADRIFVAGKLATCGDAPSAVIRYLAKDNIEVARCVLRTSPVLQPLDLLTVIAATGAEHHRLIAERPALAPDVERALRLMGDGETIAAIDRKNAEAAGSIPAAVPAPPVRIAPSRVEAILPPMRRPSDPLRLNPEELGFDAFLALDRAARLRLFGDLTTRPPARRYGGPANRLDQAFRSILGAAQIVGFARRGQTAELVAAIAEGLDLDADLVRRAIDDRSGEAFVVLLKVLGLDNIQAQQVLLLATPAIGKDVAAFFKLADIFAALESFVAESLVAAWHGGASAVPVRHDPVFAENPARRQGIVPAEVRRDREAPARKTALDGTG